MKIAVTGTSSGFGKWLVENRTDIIPFSFRNEAEISQIIKGINECDVLINHAYNNTLQSTLFEKLFLLWLELPKTIVNFGTSAIHSYSGFAPRYVSDKQHLITISKEFCERYKNKRVRVVNFNPSTLENNNMFPHLNKLSFESLGAILDNILSLPQEIEISDITIKRTSTDIRISSI